MYEKLISWIIVILLQIILFENCFANSNDEQSIIKTLDDFSKRIIKIKADVKRKYHLDRNTYNPGNHQYEKYLNSELTTVIREVLSATEKYDVNKIENEDLRRQLYRIKFSEQKLDDKLLQGYVNSISTISNTLYKSNLCRFKNDENEAKENECSLAYIPDVKNIVQHSTDIEEMKFHWTQFRDNNYIDTVKNFKDVVEFRRALSKAQGVRRTSKSVYYFQEDQQFRRELVTAMADLKPFYDMLHSTLRYAIMEEFENEFEHGEKLIPHYLLEFGKSRLKNKHFEIRNFDLFVSNIHMRPRMAMSTARKFFNRISLPDIRKALNSHFVQIMENDTLDDQCVPIMHEVAYKMCPKINFAVFKHIFSDVIQFQYERDLSKLQFGFDQEPIPGFKTALGQAIALSASSQTYLKKIEAFKNHTFEPQYDKIHLRDMAIDLMFDLQLNYVNELFLLKVYDDNIEQADYNSVYWKLMEEVAGFCAPSGRENDHLDFNYEMFNNFSAYSSLSKVVTQLAGYQIFAALCPNDEPLLNCDLSERDAAGKVLSDIITMGSTKSYADFMEILTGEVTISASGILKYYEPYTSGKEEISVRRIFFYLCIFISTIHNI